MLVVVFIEHKFNESANGEFESAGKFPGKLTENCHGKLTEVVAEKHALQAASF